MLKKFYFTLVLITLPIFASAQLSVTTKFLTSLKSLVTTILIPLVFTLGLLFFFWGMAKYIWSAGGKEKEEGKNIMVWGIIALFVMTSVWGLVKLLQTELLVGEGTTGTIPTLK